MQTLAFISTNQIAGAKLYYDFVNYFTKQGSKEDQEHAPTILFSVPIRNIKEFENTLLFNWRNGADIFVFPKKLTEEEKTKWNEFVDSRPKATNPEKLLYYEFSAPETENQDQFAEIYKSCIETPEKTFSFNPSYLKHRFKKILKKGKEHYPEIYNYVANDINDQLEEKLKTTNTELLEKKDSPTDAESLEFKIKEIKSKIEELQKPGNIEIEAENELDKLYKFIKHNAPSKDTARILTSKEDYSIKQYLNTISKESKIIAVMGGAGPLASATYYILLAQKGVYFIGLDDSLAPYKSRCIMDATTIGNPKDFRVHYINDILLLNGFVNYLTIPCNTAHIFKNIYELFLKDCVILDIRDSVINALNLKFKKNLQKNSKTEIPEPSKTASVDRMLGEIDSKFKEASSHNLEELDYEIIAKARAASSHNSVIILGTPATVTKNLYDKKLIAAGYIHLIKPEKILLQEIYDIIFKIKKNPDLTKARQKFYKIIDLLKEKYPKAVILFVCTELSIFYILNGHHLKLQGSKIASSTHALSTYASKFANSERSNLNHEDVKVEIKEGFFLIGRKKGKSFADSFHTPQLSKKPFLKENNSLLKSLNLEKNHSTISFSNIFISKTNSNTNETESNNNSISAFPDAEETKLHNSSTEANIFETIVNAMYDIDAKLDNSTKKLIISIKKRNSLEKKQKNKFIGIFVSNFSGTPQDTIDIEEILCRIRDSYSYIIEGKLNKHDSCIQFKMNDSINQIIKDLNAADIKIVDASRIVLHR